MPIKQIAESHLVQVCAGCSAEHTISFDRGAQKAGRSGDDVIIAPYLTTGYVTD